MIKNYQPTIFVVSGPSGVGKTTLVKRLLEKDDNLVFSISTTTRKPRSDERDGREYYFVSREEFERLKEEEVFAEYALVHGELYGTRKDLIDKELSSEKDVVLDIDVQGAAKIKSSYPNGVYVFIIPPDERVLSNRLHGREGRAGEDLNQRLERAESEMEHAGDYDYLVVNDNIEKSIALLRAIVSAERCRRERLWL